MHDRNAISPRILAANAVKLSDEALARHLKSPDLTPLARKVLEAESARRAAGQAVAS